MLSDCATARRVESGDHASPVKKYIFRAGSAGLVLKLSFGLTLRCTPFSSNRDTTRSAVASARRRELGDQQTATTLLGPSQEGDTLRS